MVSYKKLVHGQVQCKIIIIFDALMTENGLEILLVCENYSKSSTEIIILLCNNVFCQNVFHTDQSTGYTIVFALNGVNCAI